MELRTVCAIGFSGRGGHKYSPEYRILPPQVDGDMIYQTHTIVKEIALPEPRDARALKRYASLIESVTPDPIGYTEKHHILPKSMGGSDNKSNIVSLSARQHFVAHLLLWKAYRTKGMALAYKTMSHRFGIRINSRHYEAVRREASLVSDETKKKLSKAFTGRKRAPFTEETKRRMSEARIGMKFSEETRSKMSQSAKLRTKNRKHTEETRSRMSEIARDREAKKYAAGFVVSDETRAKIGDKSRKAWERKRQLESM